MSIRACRVAISEWQAAESRDYLHLLGADTALDAPSPSTETQATGNIRAQIIQMP